MATNLERLMQRAKAERPKPAMLPSNALPIVAETHLDLPALVDGLIAAGKLAEADRPRCVFWREFTRLGEPLSPEQLALVRTQVAIAKEKVPDVAAAYVLTMGRVLEYLNPPEAKTEKDDSL